MDKLLNDLKEYLRIDGDEENSSLSSFLQATILYLENSGVSQPSNYYLKVGDVDVYAEHRLAVHMLATHFYENRNVINPTSIKVAQIPIPFGLQSLILQLKWVYVE